jgi:prevent-host-death family protein
MIVVAPEVSMKRRISTLNVRQNLGDILNHVALRHDEYVIERKGKPLAALVPVDRLQRMEEAARLHLLSVLDACESDLSASEADTLALEAQRAVRRKKARPTR